MEDLQKLLFALVFFTHLRSVSHSTDVSKDIFMTPAADLAEEGGVWIRECLFTRKNDSSSYWTLPPTIVLVGLGG